MGLSNVRYDAPKRKRKTKPAGLHLTRKLLHNQRSRVGGRPSTWARRPPAALPLPGSGRRGSYLGGCGSGPLGFSVLHAPVGRGAACPSHPALRARAPTSPSAAAASLSRASRFPLTPRWRSLPASRVSRPVTPRRACLFSPLPFSASFLRGKAKHTHTRDQTLRRGGAGRTREQA